MRLFFYCLSLEVGGLPIFKLFEDKADNADLV